MNLTKVLAMVCCLLLTTAASGQTVEEKKQKQNQSEKKELVVQFIQLLETKQLDRLGEVIANDYQQHNPMVKPGLAGLQAGASWFLSIFPDLSASIDAIVLEDNLVVARITWTGTHSAELFGIPASGVTASWTGTDWWRIEDGRLVEHWDVVDWSGLMNQISK